MATIKNIHDYSDIINLPYKKSKKYKHMSQKDRAAQFAPFAALTGHKQLIQETQRLTEDKKELDENKKSILNQKLLYFIETKEKIKITYFKKDQKKIRWRLFDDHSKNKKDRFNLSNNYSSKWSNN